MTTHPPLPTGNHIIAAGPDWAALQPASALVVSLPRALVLDLVSHYTREMQANAACRFKVFTFDEWLAEILKDRIYGRGEETGAVADWMER